MTTLDNREQAFETKFAHDEQLRFKVTARRNKLLGQWAASQIGRSDVDAYAKEVVMSDFAEAGDNDVLQKVLADLQAANVETDELALRRKMDSLLAEAKQQVMAE